MVKYIVKTIVGISTFTANELMKFLITQPILSSALFYTEYGWILPAFQGCVLIVQAAMRGYQVYTYVRGRKTYVCTLIATPEDIELKTIKSNQTTTSEENKDNGTTENNLNEIKDVDLTNNEPFMIIDKNMIIDYF